MGVSAHQTRTHLLAQAEIERQRGARRAERLLQHAARAGQILSEVYGARRVWLFGSLAAGQPTSNSDVDLAAEGLEPNAYFNALSDLMALFQGPVDLVCWEDAAESLRERILAEGREL